MNHNIPIIIIYSSINEGLHNHLLDYRLVINFKFYFLINWLFVD